jgi:MFS family permease
VQLHRADHVLRFLLLEAVGAGLCVGAILASGALADRFGRRVVLGISAVLIGAYSGFAPQLLGAGAFGEAVYMLGGFVLLGLSFGQSSGAVNSSFPAVHRYTGAAITQNAAWFIGAGFAPLVALFLASTLGLWSVGLYLLSGVIGTLAALLINREWAARENAAGG